MNEFNYYATFDESMALLRDLVGHCGITLIPDAGAFQEPEAPAFNAVTQELIEQLRRRRALFLAGEFSRHPPKMTQMRSGPNAGTYYISIPEGGPLIQMTIATVNPVDNQPTLIGGNLNYQRLYQNPDTGGSGPASPELKEAFKEIVGTLKKRLVSHQLGLRIWIGPEALRLLEQKAVRIIDRGVLKSD